MTLPSTRFALLAVLLSCTLGADTLTIEIDYAGLAQKRIVQTEYAPGTTALELLKNVASVRTKTAGGYTFVTAIDGIASEPGKMGWFYSIDGSAAPTMPDRFILENARTMRWHYRVEACY